MHTPRRRTRTPIPQNLFTFQRLLQHAARQRRRQLRVHLHRGPVERQRSQIAGHLASTGHAFLHKFASDLSRRRQHKRRRCRTGSYRHVPRAIRVQRSAKVLRRPRPATPRTGLDNQTRLPVEPFHADTLAVPPHHRHIRARVRTYPNLANINDRQARPLEGKPVVDPARRTRAVLRAPGCLAARGQRLFETRPRICQADRPELVVQERRCDLPGVIEPHPVFGVCEVDAGIAEGHVWAWPCDTSRIYFTCRHGQAAGTIRSSAESTVASPDFFTNLAASGSTGVPVPEQSPQLQSPGGQTSVVNL